jgi:hypothetical protein
LERLITPPEVSTHVVKRPAEAIVIGLLAPVLLGATAGTAVSPELSGFRSSIFGEIAANTESRGRDASTLASTYEAVG